MTKQKLEVIQNQKSAPVQSGGEGHWESSWKVLTPSMRKAGGRLGVVQQILKPGRIGCPFHWHSREDEVFFVLSGRGILRYGESLREIQSGDCISCPAGIQVAHQIANPFDEDLVYLAIGLHHPHEICGYPDSGKILVRELGKVGQFDELEYLEGEPQEAMIFQQWKQQQSSRPKG